MSGGAGNDYIEGGTGADILNGMACSQACSDTVGYINATGGVNS